MSILPLILGRGVVVGSTAAVGGGSVSGECSVAVGRTGVCVGDVGVAVGGTSVFVDSLFPQPIIEARRITTVMVVLMERVDMVLFLLPYPSIHELSGSVVGSSKNCSMMSNAHSLLRVTPCAKPGKT
jgi:hypothetical protein